MKFKNILYIIMCCFVVSGVACTHSNQGITNSDRENVETKFLSLYDQWREEWQEDMNNFSSVSLSSRAEDHINYDSFREIINLGEPALPFVIEKMKEENSSIFLWRAAREISQVDLRGDNVAASEQELTRRYIVWWNEQNQE